LKRVIRNKFEDEIRDYLYHQVDVELDRYRNDQTRQFDTHRMIFLDWNAMSKRDQQKVEDAIYAPYSNYTLQSAGSWMKCIVGATEK